MPHIAFDSFSVDAPPGWGDITDSVEADEPPFTLARNDGFGALQFSIGLCVEGPVPNPSPEILSEMVASFAEARGLDTPSDVAVESGPLGLSAASFAWGKNFLRVWQISDGRNFAFVTFTCESGREGQELGECEGIVRTIRFHTPGGPA
jgi:hypothetical protein